MSYAEFLAWLRPLLWQSVGPLAQAGGPEPRPDNLQTIREDQPAFKAAKLMRSYRQTWLVVEDVSGKVLGFLPDRLIPEALRFVETAPFLGETAVADLMRPPDPA